MGRVTDISYDKLIVWLLPIRLRKPKLIAWLKVLCFPVHNFLYSSFKEWELSSAFDIKHQSGAVAHLEYLLSKKMGYNPELRLIRIGPGQRPARLYLPMRAQNNPIYLGRVYVYNTHAYLFGEYDFVVQVEESIMDGFNEEYCKALVNRYKRDSKNYIIRYEAF